MTSKQFRQYIETIEQKITALKKEQTLNNWREISTALEGLQLIYEEMQSSVEAAEAVEIALIEQNERIAKEYQHYHKLFHSSPIAYLITDPHGLILEANQAIAKMLNIPQRYFLRKPLAVYIAEGDRLKFYTKVNQLSGVDNIQTWQMNLCPRKGKPFATEMKVAIVRNSSGNIEKLQIGVYDMSRHQQKVDLPAQQLDREAIQTQIQALGTTLPQSLDGLQVLVVDDEADVREFITAVLESHGIRVTTVATAAAALETLEKFHPDVLMSDIRMPQEDGYSLIRKVRELGKLQGWHIPSAALTAYSDEGRDKALSAGFEAYLHKLAQPSEFIDLVFQLAQHNSSPTL